ncbi:hypothetical protein JCGZ_08211 [Jatropha curcas]|uniref:Uncharacterized protein n=1 Tax=Jatropha curcas TaxID=180498 RepID=A0A067KXB9_JATCU|nr:neurofilament heavy polypeptide [Jatropha curcas]KDP36920.1 hypothetical protein JCGZ_08211 [Jatropha curcas]
MPSEDAKAAKVKEEGKAETDAEDKSLSSILQARKKNPTNAGTLITKPRPKDGKVKKEEPQFAEDSIKVKSSSGSRPKPAKVKKEDENGDDSDRKPTSKDNSAAKVDKELIKKKKKNEEEKKKGSVLPERNGKKREKKVYDLPGQKRDPPEERDPIRIFYESLYKQLPKSEMAQIWMMESGLLSKEEAKKVYEMKQKKNQNKLSSPIKAVTTAKKSQSATVKRTTAPSPISSIKKKATDSKPELKQPKKRKVVDGSSNEDSDDDFIVNRSIKKQRAS